MPLYFPTVAATTWANKPSSYPTGQPLFISNAGTKGSHWFYDGTRWKPVGGSIVLATLDTASAAVTNAAESLVFRYLIPAAMLQSTDRLRLTYNVTKNGAVDSGTVRFRMGTAGTTSDTQLYNSGTALSTANLLGANIVDFRIESATTIQQMNSSGNNGSIGYSQNTSTAILTAVTISNVSNALYFSLGILSGGATNTVSLLDAQLALITSAN